MPAYQATVPYNNGSQIETCSLYKQDSFFILTCQDIGTSSENIEEGWLGIMTDSEATTPTDPEGIWLSKSYGH